LLDPEDATGEIQNVRRIDAGLASAPFASQRFKAVRLNLGPQRVVKRFGLIRPSFYGTLACPFSDYRERRQITALAVNVGNGMPIGMHLAPKNHGPFVSGMPLANWIGRIRSDGPRIRAGGSVHRDRRTLGCRNPCSGRSFWPARNLLDVGAAELDIA